jgi:hypothetical protein
VEDSFNVTVVAVGNSANASIQRIDLPEDDVRVLSVGRGHLSQADRQTFVGAARSRHSVETAKFSGKRAADLFRADFEVAELVIIVSTLEPSICRGATPRLVNLCHNIGTPVVSVIRSDFRVDGSSGTQQALTDYTEWTRHANASLLIPPRDLIQSRKFQSTEQASSLSIRDEMLERTIKCLCSLAKKRTGLELLEQSGVFKYAHIIWDEDFSIVREVDTITTLPDFAPTSIRAASSVVNLLRCRKSRGRPKIRAIGHMLERQLPGTTQLFRRFCPKQISGFELTLLAFFSNDPTPSGPFSNSSYSSREAPGANVLNKVRYGQFTA